MIKYVILDVDRTLVDSFKPELLSFKEALENVMNYKMSDEQSMLFTTLPTKELLKVLNLNNEQINKVMKYIIVIIIHIMKVARYRISNFFLFIIAIIMDNIKNKNVNI